MNVAIQIDGFLNVLCEGREDIVGLRRVAATCHV